MHLDRIDEHISAADLIALRREFHTYPEAGWTEYRTTWRIVEELRKLGLEPRYGKEIHVKEKMYGLPDGKELAACEARARAEGVPADMLDAMRGGFTGCIVEICGALPGPTTGVRVDIDCNEVEESDAPAHRPACEGFRSQHPGLTHACGHDAHAAIGIGLARLLCACREQLHGKVVLCFQPAEEGLRGAASLAAAGHFSGCDYFFGGHIGLKLNTLGQVAAGSHGFLASTKFDAHFRGKAAHAGAAPELGHNALAAAACAALNMLAIARHSAGASRINVGTLHAGTGRNVIPERAAMAIETRGVTSKINAYMEQEAQRVCKAAADMYGCEYESRFMGAAGSAVCDAPLISRAAKVLRALPGVTEVMEDIDFGGGEDVTFMMLDVQAHGGQATEMVFGTPLAAAHHNGAFDIDEGVISIAARGFAALALEMGENPPCQTKEE